MADDWDLFAVVRSCQNSTAPTATASTTSSSPAKIRNRELGDDNPCVNLPSFQQNQDGDHLFYFPGVIDEREDSSFQGLEEIYKELYLDCAAQNDQTKIQVPPQVQPHQQIPHLPIRHGILGSFSSTNNNPQSARPRRRKNQQAKVTHHMTQEELSTDSWAWRKYGQKPIKGSPYPRCSTSKGCSARKQVERSPTDADIFVVSYSGEHTHPRPTHRSSLAGSTRSKLSSATKPPTTMTAHPTLTTTTTTTSSASSPVTSTCRRRPMMEEVCESEGEGEENNYNVPAEIVTSLGNIIEEEEDDVEGEGEEEEEEEDILIPNSFITDDTLKGFQELSRGGARNGSESNTGAGVADNLSCSLLSPPWTPNS